MKRQSIWWMMILAIAFVALAIWSTQPGWATDVHGGGETAGAAKAVHDDVAASHGASHGEARDAHGADNASKLMKLELIPMLFTIAVFVALVLILRATAWKPILQGLKAREEAIRNSIEAAAKARADAERTTRELEAKMAEAQRQSAQQLVQAKADAQKLADAIKAQAEAESTALRDRTLRDIEAAKQQALAEINTHAADLGVAVARKILKRDVGAGDQQRLVEESLAELAAAKT